MFAEHEIVWSNGMPSESLLAGPEAMKVLSAEAYFEIQTLFSKIAKKGFLPAAARYIPKRGKLIRKMVRRHQKNDKILYGQRLKGV